MCYSNDMSRSLHVRLDQSSAAALQVVRGGSMSDSEAVRTALRESAARRRTRSSIAEEVERLAADDADRAEMRIVREQMAKLAPESLD
jgi:Arc/MetJ-type ribon-helix-helix transcriptional regulator